MVVAHPERGSLWGDPPTTEAVLNPCPCSGRASVVAGGVWGGHHQGTNLGSARRFTFALWAAEARVSSLSRIMLPYLGTALTAVPFHAMPTTLLDGCNSPKVFMACFCRWGGLLLEDSPHYILSCPLSPEPRTKFCAALVKCLSSSSEAKKQSVFSSVGYELACFIQSITVYFSKQESLSKSCPWRGRCFNISTFISLFQWCYLFLMYFGIDCNSLGLYAKTDSSQSFINKPNMITNLGLTDSVSLVRWVGWPAVRAPVRRLAKPGFCILPSNIMALKRSFHLSKHHESKIQRKYQ